MRQHPFGWSWVSHDTATEWLVGLAAHTLMAKVRGPCSGRVVVLHPMMGPWTVGARVQLGQ